MSKGHKCQPERALNGPSLTNMNNKIHHNAKYKISIHESGIINK